MGAGQDVCIGSRGSGEEGRRLEPRVHKSRKYVVWLRKIGTSALSHVPVHPNNPRTLFLARTLFLTKQTKIIMVQSLLRGTASRFDWGEEPAHQH